MARTFFAIWPQPCAREALEHLARDVALVAHGKPVEGIGIHLTLAFLGDVDAARTSLARTAAARVDVPRFELSLDRIGSFRGSRVAWAGATRTPEALTALHGGLEQDLRALGFALEERAFRPHVTLARKTQRHVPAASIAPIVMACEAIALVVSDLATGAYSTLESWPLA